MCGGAGQLIYWRVSRPLQRRGYHKHLLPSMPDMTKAVRGLGDEDRAWKVQFVYALAAAYAQGAAPASLRCSASVLASPRSLLDKCVHDSRAGWRRCCGWGCVWLTLCACFSVGLLEPCA